MLRQRYYLLALSKCSFVAVVVAHLTEETGSNPVIGSFYLLFIVRKT